MTETISVSVSGAVFSLLLYETAKSEHDQEGFLLGNVITKEIQKLTDADHGVVNKEHTIKVKSPLPCPHLFYFYNSAGKIDTEKLNDFLGPHQSNVIGWYVYRHKRTSLKLTFQEKMIHKQLAEFFNPPISHFSCCVLTRDTSRNKSTHTFCQKFIRYNRASYENLPFHIANLSDSNFNFKSAEPASEIVNNLIEGIKSSGESEGHVIAKQLQDGLQSHMKELIGELSHKEQELFKLEQEVKQLMQNVKWKRDFQADGDNNNSNLKRFETPTIIENAEIIRDDECQKKRGRPRKDIGNAQNNSPHKTDTECNDSSIDKKENQLPVRSTRSKTNISYSEMTQRKT